MNPKHMLAFALICAILTVSHCNGVIVYGTTVGPGFSRDEGKGAYDVYGMPSEQLLDVIITCRHDRLSHHSSICMWGWYKVHELALQAAKWFRS